MKKLYLLLFLAFFIPHAHAQNTQDRCTQGACSGFGPPIGACVGSFIYSDISQTPVQAYSCKAGAWALQGGGSGGGASFTPTGIQFATSTTAATVATAAQVVAAIGTTAVQNATSATTSTTRAQGNNSTNIATTAYTDTAAGAAQSGAVSSLTLKQVAKVWAFGDSFFSGAGATSAPQTSAISLISQRTPAALKNAGVAGAPSNYIGNEAFSAFLPDPVNPSVSLINGGANDGFFETCGLVTGSACVKGFTAETTATAAWVTIPSQFRIMASKATATGTWTADTTVAQAVPVSTVSNGTAMKSSVASSTLTFNIPSSASSQVGVRWFAVNAQTGTFTVTVDGTTVTDPCLAATTFSSAPCITYMVGGVSSTFGEYEEFFPVTPGSTHTVVVTTTNSANSGIISVDWIPPAGTANTNTAFYVSTITIWPGSTIYNAAAQTMVTTLASYGLPIYFVDLINGTPGVNSTTDISTVATTLCPASTSNNHPNDCGYYDMAATIQNAEIANGFLFSNYQNAGYQMQSSGVFTAPLQIPVPSGTRVQAYSYFNSGAALSAGIDWFRGAQTYGTGFHKDASTGNPYSGAFINSSYGSTSGAGYSCIQGFNNSTAVADADYTSVHCISFATGASYQLGPMQAPVVQLTTTTAATCSSTIAGQIQYTQGNSTTKDVVEVCAHDATNTYAWRPIY